MSEALGRLISEDERDRNYPMQAVVPARSDRTWRYWYPSGAWWDQGQTGTCVGHAWGHWVEDGPVTHKGQVNVVDPIDIYCACTLIDPWPANDNCDLQYGTSVRAGAKVLQNQGIITEYRWAWDVDTVVLALLEAGPVVMGSWWKYNMYDVDRRGFVDVSGGNAGGHAYVLNGVNVEAEKIRMKNSWGRGWGNRGHAWLRFDDLALLLAEQGEACLAGETRR